MKESDANPMIFKNEKHSAAFRDAVRKLNRKNNALMSAVYLLNADNKLWNHSKQYVERNEVRFDTMRPKDGTENGYTLCCTVELAFYEAKQYEEIFARVDSTVERVNERTLRRVVPCLESYAQLKF